MSISSPTTPRASPPTARQYPHHQRNLLAGALPGLRFKNSLKRHPTKVGAAILVVEVTEKPVDLYGRVDNRGTKARGPG